MEIECSFFKHSSFLKPEVHITCLNHTLHFECRDGSFHVEKLASLQHDVCLKHKLSDILSLLLFLNHALLRLASKDVFKELGFGSEEHGPQTKIRWYFKGNINSLPLISAMPLKIWGLELAV